MEPFKPRDKHGQEYWIQQRFVDFFKAKDWHVEIMTAGKFIKGIPDILIGHKNYGMRFIDLKVHGKYSFTKMQKITWPIWESHGMGIWILGATSKKDCTKSHMIEQYNLLFEPPNWRNFWKDSWDDKPDIDKMLEELGDAS